MPQKPVVFNLVRCGPGDVARELKKAGEIVDEWNSSQGLDSNFFVRHAHWSTDAAPDMSERPQAVINRQLIDKADLIVAVFWKRFGTPTGVSASGTQEEIERAIKQGKRVMLYFSDIEDIRDGDDGQKALVKSFRDSLSAKGLYWPYRSRAEFEKLFRTHLASAVQELTAKHQKPVPKRKKAADVSQTGSANANIQGDHNQVDQRVYHKQRKIKLTVPPPENAVTPAQKKKIEAWVDELVDCTANTTRPAAYGMWWKRLQNECKVTRYEDILSSQMGDVEKWFRKNRAMGVRKQRTKAPDLWRKARITAIKAAMKSVGRTNDDYYPEIARRLKMKPFDSITKLTKTDLERVYRMVLKDAGNS